LHDDTRQNTGRSLSLGDLDQESRGKQAMKCLGIYLLTGMQGAGTMIQLAARSIAARLRSTSSWVVAQLETLMRMAVRPCHTVEPHQQTPSF
jgi:hypothetical protein